VILDHACSVWQFPHTVAVDGIRSRQAGQRFVPILDWAVASPKIIASITPAQMSTTTIQDTGSASLRLMGHSPYWAGG
jgi:hypothetical protein